MPTIKKFGNEYYFCTISATRIGRKRKKRIYRKQFLVKYGSEGSGGGYMTTFRRNCTIYCPIELIGKRIRLKVEIIKENEQRN